MKSKLLVIATTALLFTACSDSFLDRAPEGNYVDATFYTSDEALEAATAFTIGHGLITINVPSFLSVAGVPMICTVPGIIRSLLLSK